MEKKLSIIIPHYNTPDLLKRLLDSIVPEKRDDTEVIVVDDHSTRTEEYQETIRQFPEVMFYSNHPQKKNAGAARNTGLEKATGTWLLFADADDVFLPGWYGIVSEYFDQSYDIVYFSPEGKRIINNMSETYRQKWKAIISGYLEDPSETNENILRYCFSVPWSKLISGNMVREKGIQFDEIQYGNDNLFSARCGAAAKTIHADQRNIYCSIKNPESLCSITSREIFTNRSKTQCRTYAFIRTQIGSRKAKQLPIARLIYNRLCGIQKRHYGTGCYIRHIAYFLRYRIPLLPSIKYALGRIKKKSKS